MKSRVTVIAAMLLSFAIGRGSALSDDYPRSPGIDILHYTFELVVGDESDEMVGEATVRFRSEGASASELVLDLIGRQGAVGMQVGSVTIEGEGVPFTHEQDKLRIPLDGRDGETSATIRYRGVPADGLVIADNLHGERTFSADNWPNKTRFWLPTLDHPYDKATCEFVVTAPDHYQVIANGLKLEESNLPGGLMRTHWKQSVPISTWLMVMSVARYAVQYVDDYNGVEIQTWVFPQDRDAGFYDFARARRPLEFFSTHVGEYAYEKLANVQVTAPVGATEAATAVFYQQDFVSGERRREWVIAHEIAHHWFGNAVTESDWNDVWLSEGFATYFTLLFTEYVDGRDRFVEGLLESRERVFRFYDDNPDYRIVHENLTNMAEVTTGNTYQKGAWILHMLRGIVGDENFWTGIRDYYREFKNENATTADFRRAMERAAGADLEWFFEQWLYQGGNLVLDGSWSFDAGAGSLTLDLTQSQKEAVTFRMPIQVEITDASGTRIETVQVDGDTSRFEIATTERPSTVRLDPDHWVLMRAELVPH